MFCNQNNLGLDALSSNAHQSFQRRRYQAKADTGARKPICKTSHLRPYFENNFSDDFSDTISQNFLRYVKQKRKFIKETPAFIDELRSKILYLHKYNTERFEVAGEYNLSETFVELILHHIILECNLLYNKGFFSKRYEQRVQDRILRLLLTVYRSHFESKMVPEKKIFKESSKAIIRLFIRLRTEFELHNDVLENIVVKLLGKTGELEKMEALKGRHLPCSSDTYLRDIEVINMCKKVITSDYGTDESSNNSYLVDGPSKVIDLDEGSNGFEDDNINSVSEPNDATTPVSLSEKISTILQDDSDSEIVFMPVDREMRDMPLVTRRTEARRRRPQRRLFSRHKPLLPISEGDAKIEPKEEIFSLDSSDDEPNSSREKASVYSRNNTQKLTTVNAVIVDNKILEELEILESSDKECEIITPQQEARLLSKDVDHATTVVDLRTTDCDGDRKTVNVADISSDDDVMIVEDESDVPPISVPKITKPKSDKFQSHVDELASICPELKRELSNPDKGNDSTGDQGTQIFQEGVIIMLDNSQAMFCDELPAKFDDPYINRVDTPNSCDVSVEVTLSRRTMSDADVDLDEIEEVPLSSEDQITTKIPQVQLSRLSSIDNVDKIQKTTRYRSKYILCDSLMMSPRHLDITEMPHAERPEESLQKDVVQVQQISEHESPLLKENNDVVVQDTCSNNTDEEVTTYDGSKDFCNQNIETVLISIDESVIEISDSDLSDNLLETSESENTFSGPGEQDIVSSVDQNNASFCHTTLPEKSLHADEATEIDDAKEITKVASPKEVAFSSMDQKVAEMPQVEISENPLDENTNENQFFDVTNLSSVHRNENKVDQTQLTKKAVDEDIAAGIAEMTSDESQTTFCDTNIKVIRQNVNEIIPTDFSQESLKKDVNDVEDMATCESPINLCDRNDEATSSSIEENATDVLQKDLDVVQDIAEAEGCKRTNEAILSSVELCEMTLSHKSLEENVEAVEKIAESECLLTAVEQNVAEIPPMDLSQKLLEKGVHEITEGCSNSLRDRSNEFVSSNVEQNVTEHPQVDWSQESFDILEMYQTDVTQKSLGEDAKEDKAKVKYQIQNNSEAISGENVNQMSQTHPSQKPLEEHICELQASTIKMAVIGTLDVIPFEMILTESDVPSSTEEKKVQNISPTDVELTFSRLDLNVAEMCQVNVQQDSRDEDVRVSSTSSSQNYEYAGTTEAPGMTQLIDPSLEKSFEQGVADVENPQNDTGASVNVTIQTDDIDYNVIKKCNGESLSDHAILRSERELYVKLVPLTSDLDNSNLTAIDEAQLETKNECAKKIVDGNIKTMDIEAESNLLSDSGIELTANAAVVSKEVAQQSQPQKHVETVAVHLEKEPFEYIDCSIQQESAESAELLNAKNQTKNIESVNENQQEDKLVDEAFSAKDEGGFENSTLNEQILDRISKLECEATDFTNIENKETELRDSLENKESPDVIENSDYPSVKDATALRKDSPINDVFSDCTASNGSELRVISDQESNLDTAEPIMIIISDETDMFVGRTDINKTESITERCTNEQHPNDPLEQMEVRDHMDNNKEGVITSCDTELQDFDDQSNESVNQLSLSDSHNESLEIATLSEHINGLVSELDCLIQEDTIGKGETQLNIEDTTSSINELDQAEDCAEEIICEVVEFDMSMMGKFDHRESLQSDPLQEYNLSKNDLQVVDAAENEIEPATETICVKASNRPDSMEVNEEIENPLVDTGAEEVSSCNLGIRADQELLENITDTSRGSNKSLSTSILNEPSASLNEEDNLWDTNLRSPVQNAVISEGTYSPINEIHMNDIVEGNYECVGSGTFQIDTDGDNSENHGTEEHISSTDIPGSFPGTSEYETDLEIVSDLNIQNEEVVTETTIFDAAHGSDCLLPVQVVQNTIRTGNNSLELLASVASDVYDMHNSPTKDLGKNIVIFKLSENDMPAFKDLVENVVTSEAPRDASPLKIFGKNKRGRKKKSTKKVEQIIKAKVPRGRKNYRTNENSEPDTVRRSSRCKADNNDSLQFKPNNFLPLNLSVQPPPISIYTKQVLEINTTSEDSNDSEVNNLLIDEDCHAKSAIDEVVANEPNTFDEDTLEDPFKFCYDPRVHTQLDTFSHIARIFDATVGTLEAVPNATHNLISNAPLISEDEHFHLDMQNSALVEGPDIDSKSLVARRSRKPFRTKAERKAYNNNNNKSDLYVSIEKLDSVEASVSPTRLQSLDSEYKQSCGSTASGNVDIRTKPESKVISAGACKDSFAELMVADNERDDISIISKTIDASKGYVKTETNTPKKSVSLRRQSLYINTDIAKPSNVNFHVTADVKIQSVGSESSSCPNVCESPNKKYYTAPKLRQKPVSRDNLNRTASTNLVEANTLGDLKSRDGYLDPLKLLTVKAPLEILPNCKNTVTPTTEKLKKKLESDKKGDFRFSSEKGQPSNDNLTSGPSQLDEDLIDHLVAKYSHFGTEPSVVSEKNTTMPTIGKLKNKLECHKKENLRFCSKDQLGRRSKNLNSKPSRLDDDLIDHLVSKYSEDVGTHIDNESSVTSKKGYYISNKARYTAGDTLKEEEKIKEVTIQETFVMKETDSPYTNVSDLKIKTPDRGRKSSKPVKTKTNSRRHRTNRDSTKTGSTSDARKVEAGALSKTEKIENVNHLHQQMSPKIDRTLRARSKSIIYNAIEVQDVDKSHFLPDKIDIVKPEVVCSELKKKVKSTSGSNRYKPDSLESAPISQSLHLPKKSGKNIDHKKEYTNDGINKASSKITRKLRRRSKSTAFDAVEIKDFNLSDSLPDTNESKKLDPNIIMKIEDNSESILLKPSSPIKDKSLESNPQLQMTVGDFDQHIKHRVDDFKKQSVESITKVTRILRSRPPSAAFTFVEADNFDQDESLLDINDGKKVDVSCPEVNVEIGDASGILVNKSGGTIQESVPTDMSGTSSDPLYITEGLDDSKKPLVKEASRITRKLRARLPSNAAEAEDLNQLLKSSENKKIDVGCPEFKTKSGDTTASIVNKSDSGIHENVPTIPMNVSKKPMPTKKLRTRSHSLEVRDLNKDQSLGDTNESIKSDIVDTELKVAIADTLETIANKSEDAPAKSDVVNDQTKKAEESFDAFTKASVSETTRKLRPRSQSIAFNVAEVQDSNQNQPSDTNDSMKRVNCPELTTEIINTSETIVNQSDITILKHTHAKSKLIREHTKMTGTTDDQLHMPESMDHALRKPSISQTSKVSRKLRAKSDVQDLNQSIVACQELAVKIGDTSTMEKADSTMQENALTQSNLLNPLRMTEAVDCDLRNPSLSQTPKGGRKLRASLQSISFNEAEVQDCYQSDVICPELAVKIGDTSEARVEKADSTMQIILPGTTLDQLDMTESADYDLRTSSLSQTPKGCRRLRVRSQSIALINAEVQDLSQSDTVCPELAVKIGDTSEATMEKPDSTMEENASITSKLVNNHTSTSLVRLYPTDPIDGDFRKPSLRQTDKVIRRLRCRSQSMTFNAAKVGDFNHDHSWPENESKKPDVVHTELDLKIGDTLETIGGKSDSTVQENATTKSKLLDEQTKITEERLKITEERLDELPTTECTDDDFKKQSGCQAPKISKKLRARSQRGAEVEQLNQDHSSSRKSNKLDVTCNLKVEDSLEPTINQSHSTFQENAAITSKLLDNQTKITEERFDELPATEFTDDDFKKQSVGQASKISKKVRARSQRGAEVEQLNQDHCSSHKSESNELGMTCNIKVEDTSKTTKSQSHSTIQENAATTSKLLDDQTKITEERFDELPTTEFTDDDLKKQTVGQASKISKKVRARSQRGAEVERLNQDHSSHKSESNELDVTCDVKVKDTSKTTKNQSPGSIQENAATTSKLLDDQAKVTEQMLDELPATERIDVDFKKQSASQAPKISKKLRARSQRGAEVEQLNQDHSSSHKSESNELDVTCNIRVNGTPETTKNQAHSTIQENAATMSKLLDDQTKVTEERLDELPITERIDDDFTKQSATQAPKSSKKLRARSQRGAEVEQLDQDHSHKSENNELDATCQIRVGNTSESTKNQSDSTIQDNAATKSKFLIDQIKTTKDQLAVIESTNDNFKRISGGETHKSSRKGRAKSQSIVQDYNQVHSSSDTKESKKPDVVCPESPINVGDTSETRVEKCDSTRQENASLKSNFGTSVDLHSTDGLRDNFEKSLISQTAKIPRNRGARSKSKKADDFNQVHTLPDTTVKFDIISPELAMKSKGTSETFMGKSVSAKATKKFKLNDEKKLNTASLDELNKTKYKDDFRKRLVGRPPKVPRKLKDFKQVHFVPDRNESMKPDFICSDLAMKNEYASGTIADKADSSIEVSTLPKLSNEDTKIAATTLDHLLITKSIHDAFRKLSVSQLKDSSVELDAASPILVGKVDSSIQESLPIKHIDRSFDQLHITEYTHDGLRQLSVDHIHNAPEVEDLNQGHSLSDKDESMKRDVISESKDIIELDSLPDRKDSSFCDTITKTDSSQAIDQSDKSVREVPKVIRKLRAKSSYAEEVPEFGPSQTLPDAERSDKLGLICGIFDNSGPQTSKLLSETSTLDNTVVDLKVSLSSAMETNESNFNYPESDTKINGKLETILHKFYSPVQENEPRSNVLNNSDSSSNGTDLNVPLSDIQDGKNIEENSETILQKSDSTAEKDPTEKSELLSDCSFTNIDQKTGHEIASLSDGKSSSEPELIYPESNMKILDNLRVILYKSDSIIQAIAPNKSKLSNIKDGDKFHSTSSELQVKTGDFSESMLPKSEDDELTMSKISDGSSSDGIDRKIIDAKVSLLETNNCDVTSTGSDMNTEDNTKTDLNESDGNSPKESEVLYSNSSNSTDKAASSTGKATADLQVSLSDREESQKFDLIYPKLDLNIADGTLHKSNVAIEQTPRPVSNKDEVTANLKAFLLDTKDSDKFDIISPKVDGSSETVQNVCSTIQESIPIESKLLNIAGATTIDENSIDVGGPLPSSTKLDLICSKSDKISATGISIERYYIDSDPVSTADLGNTLVSKENEGFTDTICPVKDVETDSATFNTDRAGDFERQVKDLQIQIAVLNSSQYQNTQPEKSPSLDKTLTKYENIHKEPLSSGSESSVSTNENSFVHKSKESSKQKRKRKMSVSELKSSLKQSKLDEIKIQIDEKVLQPNSAVVSPRKRKTLESVLTHLWEHNTEATVTPNINLDDIKMKLLQKISDHRSNSESKKSSSDSVGAISDVREVSQYKDLDVADEIAVQTLSGSSTSQSINSEQRIENLAPVRTLYSLPVISEPSELQSQSIADDKASMDKNIVPGSREPTFISSPHATNTKTFENREVLSNNSEYMHNAIYEKPSEAHIGSLFMNSGSTPVCLGANSFLSDNTSREVGSTINLKDLMSIKGQQPSPVTSEAVSILSQAKPVGASTSDSSSSTVKTQHQPLGKLMTDKNVNDQMNNAEQPEILSDLPINFPIGINDVSGTNGVIGEYQSSGGCRLTEIQYTYNATNDHTYYSGDPLMSGIHENMSFKVSTEASIEAINNTSEAFPLSDNQLQDFSPDAYRIGDDNDLAVKTNAGNFFLANYSLDDFESMNIMDTFIATSEDNSDSKESVFTANSIEGIMNTPEDNSNSKDLSPSLTEWSQIIENGNSKQKVVVEPNTQYTSSEFYISHRDIIDSPSLHSNESNSDSFSSENVVEYPSTSKTDIGKNSLKSNFEEFKKFLSKKSVQVSKDPLSDFILPTYSRTPVTAPPSRPVTSPPKKKPKIEILSIHTLTPPSKNLQAYQDSDVSLEKGHPEQDAIISCKDTPLVAFSKLFQEDLVENSEQNSKMDKSAFKIRPRSDLLHIRPHITTSDVNLMSSPKGDQNERITIPVKSSLDDDACTELLSKPTECENKQEYVDVKNMSLYDDEEMNKSFTAATVSTELSGKSNEKTAVVLGIADTVKSRKRAATTMFSSGTPEVKHKSKKNLLPSRPKSKRKTPTPTHSPSYEETPLVEERNPIKIKFSKKDSLNRTSDQSESVAKNLLPPSQKHKKISPTHTPTQSPSYEEPSYSKEKKRHKSSKKEIFVNTDNLLSLHHLKEGKKLKQDRSPHNPVSVNTDNLLKIQYAKNRDLHDQHESTTKHEGTKKKKTLLG